MKKRDCLQLTCILLLLLLSGALLGQQKVKVQGTVQDEGGSPLQNVSVTIKDSKQGTRTDSLGKFSINVEPGKILLFEHVGFLPYGQGITAATTLSVTLTPSDNRMDEVVVIGYGTQSRAAVTGAISKLNNKNLDEIPAARLDNALTGKIAGVNIQNVTSEVGADPQVRVRGFKSINGNEPLVVVDGYPLPDNGLSFVNPQDVASVEVLKDAAAGAIYGSRAANGVILITTKNGVPDKPKYSFKTFYGKSEPYKLNTIMTFTEYANLLYSEAALRNQDSTVAANRKNLITNQERAAYILENQISGYATDWQQLGLQDAGIFNAQLNMSGGKKDLKYYLSGSYQTNQGIMKFSQSDRASFRAKLDGNLSRKLKFSLNISPSYVKTDKPAVNYTDYFRMYSYLPAYHTAFTAAYAHQNQQWAGILPGDYAQARHFNGLLYAGLMPDGSWWQSSGPLDPWNTQNNTPLSIANRERIWQTNLRLTGNFDLSYEILPKLLFKSAVSGFYGNQKYRDFTQSDAKQDGAVNEAILRTLETYDMLWENTLNYTKKIGNHNIGLLAGYTMQQTWFDSAQIVGRDFPTENFETVSQAGQIDQALTYTNKYKTALLSYLGRISYDYRNKYLLMLTLRSDGSSLFSPGHQWGYFPSVSGGWVVSQEPFMKAVKSISNLKLRASYGLIGNNRVVPFSYENLLFPGNYSFGTGGITLGLSPSGAVLGNPLITWERTYETNLGFDLGLLNNRITLAAEYYNSKTDRLLYRQATMSFLGSNEFINNAGRISNKGIEIELNASPVKKVDFEWSTGIVFARNVNKLLELGGEPHQYNFGERNEIYAAIVGQPSIQFFGYKTTGVWTSDAEIASAQADGYTSPLSRYFQTGGLKFADVNGDKKIDQDDRVALGSPFPDFTWGFNNTIRYKNFDLYFLFQGSQGGKLINGDLNYNETRRFNSQVVANRWVSPMFPGDGKTPYFTNGENWMLTDYVMEDASYMSLRNVILGYKIPEAVLKKGAIKSMRLYFAGDNLWYLMGGNYRGINPEARSTSGVYSSPLISGYQRGAFPVMRTYTIGLDINF
ncbi:MAG: TonB-dependent receptor [Niabella sp.]